MNNTRQIRKALVWGLPLCLSMAFLFGWLILDSVIPPIKQMIFSMPVIRIRPTALLAPFALLISLVLPLGLVLKAIPYEGVWVKRLEALFNFLVFLSVGVLCLIISTSALAQSRWMPRLGYVQCDQLQDQPSVWFTDWVRNPAWCVKGKSLEWVNEQARTSVKN